MRAVPVMAATGREVTVAIAVTGATVLREVRVSRAASAASVATE